MVTCPENPIEIEEKIISKLKDQLDLLGETPVIELSNQQVYRISKNAELMRLLELREEKVQLIKNWGVDGFCLVCIIPHEEENSIIRNYYSDEEINFLKALSNIFLHLYYIQHWQVELKASLSSIGKMDSFNIDFLDVHMLEGYNVKQSLGKSEYEGDSVRGSQMG